MSQKRLFSRLLLSFVCIVVFLQSREVFGSCQQTLDQQVEVQVQRHGTDPAAVVKSTMKALHKQLQRLPNASINSIYRDPSHVQEQMSLIYKNFSLSTWLNRLSLIPKMSSLQAFDKTEINYLFTHWIRVRYLTSVYRLVANRELKEVFLENGRFPASVKQSAIHNPAQLIITGYSNFRCQDQIDNKAYDCASDMIFIHTHLSPDILCQSPKLSDDAKVNYLVQKQGHQFKIIDIEIGGRRIYKDSFDEISNLLNAYSYQNLIEYIQIWSFLKTEKTPEKEIQAFRSAVPQISSRLPASQ
ncbi:MAG: hypothetical protein KDD34_09215 [Bdellovibrionales bacterium]|nr:hypothetical protein [Bdellovibrionales bacterium]